MKPGPGKFEGCADLGTAERLYEASLGGVDEEFGSVEEGRWVAQLGDAIVEEDSNGFFSYRLFESEDAAEREFLDLHMEYRVDRDEVAS